jgi:23S rRNA pseudouridine2605 synthase
MERMSDNGPQPIRLQKYLAEAGVASRRQAEVLIATGAVSVNRQTAHLGQKVVPGVDRIVVQGKVLGAPRAEAVESLVLAVNKPAGMTCAREAVGRHLSVFELLPKDFRRRRLVVAGEIDTEAEGLVILTDDGALQQRIVHPSGGLPKRYRVRLKEPLAAARLKQIERGFTVEGEKLRVDSAEAVLPRSDGTCIEVLVTVVHDRKQLVRRLFDALHADIRRLRRIQVGGVGLKRIPLRGWKVLSKHDRLGFDAPVSRAPSP